MACLGGEGMRQWSSHNKDYSRKERHLLTALSSDFTPKWAQALCHKKLWLILALGFASGLPLGLIGTTLQAWYAHADMNMASIGFLTLIGQPYVYKFIWSPFLDKFNFGFLGLRRGWLLITQFGLILGLIAMAMMSPQTQPLLLGVAGLCVAFLSATQDIATDAYRTEILKNDERGIGVAMSTAGYRIAMLVSAGLSLIIAGVWGFTVTYFGMAALMGIGVIATLLCEEPKHIREKSASFVESFVLPFKEFLTRKNAVAILALLVLYKLGDAFAVSLTTPFLLKGVGFSLSTIGYWNKSLGMISTIAGVFVGGVMLTRLGLFRALLTFGILQTVTNLAFYLLAVAGKSLPLLILAVGLDNFAGGLGQAAFMVFVMSLCNQRYTATQFALMSAIAAIGRVYIGPVAGWVVERSGWADFFLWSIVFALPGILLLCYLRPTIMRYGEESASESVESTDSAPKAHLT